MSPSFRRVLPLVSTICAILVFMLAPILAMHSHDLFTRVAADLGLIPGYGLQAIIFLGAVWEAAVIVVIAKGLIPKEL